MPEQRLTEEDRATAGELALGVLDGDERAAALRRVLAEPAFAAEIDAWRTRLAPMLDAIEAVAPPDRLWQDIDDAVAGHDAETAVGRWRAIAGTAGAIAACLAVALIWRPQADAPAPVPITVAADHLITQLSDPKGAPLLAAQYDAATGELRVRTSNLPQGALRPELWVIGGDAKPRSLGLVALNDASRVTPPPALRGRLIQDATFALTMEPNDAPAHAAPSGTILGAAKLVML